MVNFLQPDNFKSKYAIIIINTNIRFFLYAYTHKDIAKTSEHLRNEKNTCFIPLMMFVVQYNFRCYL